MLHLWSSTYSHARVEAEYFGMRNLLSWPLARGHAKGWEAVMPIMPIMLVCISHTGMAQESEGTTFSFQHSSTMAGCGVSPRLFMLGAVLFGIGLGLGATCGCSLRLLEGSGLPGELFKLRGVQDSLCKNYISFVLALKTRGSHMDVESCWVMLYHMGLSENRVYSQWNSHLTGIRIINHWV